MIITAIQLVSIGDYALVKAEIEGRWVTLIKEHVDGAFSHIIEADGIQRIIDAVIEIEDAIKS